VILLVGLLTWCHIKVNQTKLKGKEVNGLKLFLRISKKITQTFSKFYSNIFTWKNNGIKNPKI
jgi:hypothetical protein